MQTWFFKRSFFALLDWILALHIVPQIWYLGFTTRGKKGPLSTTGDLSACKSIWSLIRIYTVNTVRKHRADRPWGLGGLSENNPRTSSTAPSITDYPRWARRLSAPSRTVRHSSTDCPQTSCNKNPSTKWIERKTRKNSWRTRWTAGWKPPRGPSVWCAHNSSSSTSWRSTPPSHYPIYRINQGIATKS
jgi:hypothetical protein